MKKGISYFLWVCVCLFGFSHQAKASPWPANPAGINLSAPLRAILPSGEPSGMAFHHELGTLVLVSDEGSVCVMNEDGTDPECVFIGSNDLEGVTIVDESTHLVYLAVEYPYSILEFSLDTMRLTGKRWNINDLSGPTNSGIEALTFIPDGAHDFGVTQSGGVFLVGHQATGQLIAYDLNLQASGNATRLAAFTPVPGRSDVADLFFHEPSGVLFAVYDANNMLTEMETDGSILGDFVIPGDDQEAITLLGDCSEDTGKMLVGEDSGPAAGPDLWVYGNYPLHCPAVDADGDGVVADQDCNDNDAAVSSANSFFIDADHDALGSSTTQQICTALAPLGFASSSGDCNDNDASVSSLREFFIDADQDSKGGTATQQICANTAPAGFSTLSGDCNDSDSSVSSTQSFFVDADHDGFGGSSGQEICAATAPFGFASTSGDCNDSNSTAHELKLFYRDADGDGLGNPGAGSSFCMMSAPAGFVDNANDNNDSLVQQRLEYVNNHIDDDGDGRIDEPNTVAENGVHALYGNTNPWDSTKFRSIVLTVRGGVNGTVIVRFADNSEYLYTPFAITTNRVTGVLSFFGTGYLSVWNPLTGRSKLINAYNGR